LHDVHCLVTANVTALRAGWVLGGIQ